MPKKTTALLLGSGLLTIAVLAPQSATAAPGGGEQLQKQIQELQHSLQTLQQKVDDLSAASAAAPADVEDTNAEGYEPPPTVSDIEGNRSDLENYKYDQERQYERKTTKSTRDTTLYGTIQVRYQAQSESNKTGNPAPNASDRYHTFDIPTALLGVKGNLYRDYNDGRNLEYQFSGSFGKRAGEAGSNSNFNLQDAFLRYNFLRTTEGLEGPRLTATFGQQLIPFGVEAQAAEDLRPTINTAMAPGQLGLFNRQAGLIFRGDLKPYVDYGANYRAPLFEYALGVVNGNASNKVDDNNSKDVVARAAFTLPVDYASVFRELKFGTSFYRGRKNVSTPGAVGGLPAAKIDSAGRRDVYGADIYYNHAPFGVTYEYWQGRTDFAKSNNVADGTGEAKSVGHSLTLFYTFGDQFFNSIKSAAKFDDSWPQSVQSYYRLDYYNPNKNKALQGVSSQDTTRAHSVGFNWFFAETTKFQFAINRYDYAHRLNSVGAENKDYTEVQAQLQYTF